MYGTRNDRQTDTEADRQTGRQTCGKADRQTGGQVTERQVDGQAGRQTEGQVTARQVDRQAWADRLKDRMFAAEKQQRPKAAADCKVHKVHGSQLMADDNPAMANVCGRCRSSSSSTGKNAVCGGLARYPPTSRSAATGSHPGAGKLTVAGEQGRRGHFRVLSRCTRCAHGVHTVHALFRRHDQPGRDAAGPLRRE